MYKRQVAGPCGGCQLQAMSYESQLEFKRRKIENHLKRIGGFSDITVPPVIGMEAVSYTHLDVYKRQRSLHWEASVFTSV